MGSKKHKREVVVADDLNWADQLVGMITDEQPPAKARSMKALVDQTGMDWCTLKRRMDKMVKSGLLQTTIYKAQRWYWPTHGETI